MIYIYRCFYCLPDGYEIVDSSLDHIKRALCPRYSSSEVAALDSSTTLRSSQLGVAYLPGFVGMNNLKKTVRCFIYDVHFYMTQYLTNVSQFNKYF